jgi:tape measure domain-containing protein
MSAEYLIKIVVAGEDRASGPLGSAGSALGNIGQIAAGIIGAQIFQNIARGIMDMGRQALDATASWERMGMAIETMTARELMHKDATLSMADALGLAGEKAEATMKWIQNLAIASPFDAEGVATTYRQALTYGFTADEAQRLTQVLVDMSAGMGLTSAEMNRASYALGQINSTDKIMIQDLRQLMAVGVPVQDVLAKMGYNMNDLSDKNVKAQISTKEFVNTLLDMMGKDFEGAGKRAATSWGGLVNSLDDIKKIGLREFFSSTFEAIQPYVVSFVEKFSDPAFQQSLKEWGKPLGEMVKDGIKLASTFIEIFSLIKNGTTGDGSLSKLVSLFQSLGISDAMSLRIAGVIQNLRQLISGKIDGFDFLKSLGIDPKTVDLIEQILAKLGKTFSEIFSGASKEGGTFLPIILKIAEVLGKAFVEALEYINTNWVVFDALLKSTALVLGILAYGFLEVGLMAASIIESMINGWTALAAFFGHTISALVTGIAEIVKGIYNVFGGQMDMLVALFSGDLQGIKDGFFRWAGGLKDIALGLMNTLYGVIGTGLGIIIAPFALFLNAVVGIFQNLYDVLVGHSIVPDLMNAIVRIITTGLAAMIAVWVARLNYIRAYIAAVMYAIQFLWANAWNMMRNAVSNVMSSIAYTVQNQINIIYSMFRNTGNMLYYYGVQMIQGFENGVKAAFANLLRTLGDLIDQLPQVIKTALGIASPSKVFEEIGVNTMLGLAKGLSRASSLPVSIALSTANAVTNAAANGTPTVNNWNLTISNPRQSSGSIRDDVRLLQLMAGV